MCIFRWPLYANNETNSENSGYMSLCKSSGRLPVNNVVNSLLPRLVTLMCVIKVRRILPSCCIVRPPGEQPLRLSHEWSVPLPPQPPSPPPHPSKGPALLPQLSSLLYPCMEGRNIWREERDGWSRDKVSSNFLTPSQ